MYIKEIIETSHDSMFKNSIGEFCVSKEQQIYNGIRSKYFELSNCIINKADLPLEEDYLLEIAAKEVIKDLRGVDVYRFSESEVLEIALQDKYLIMDEKGQISNAEKDILESIWNLHFVVIKLLGKENEWYPVSEYDKKLAMKLLEESQDEQYTFKVRAQFMSESFALNPFSGEFYETLLKNDLNNRKSVLEIIDFFNIDITNLDSTDDNIYNKNIK